MFVLFYFIQNFFNYLVGAFHESCEFYRDVGLTIKKSSYHFYEFIQCLNCVLDEMYGHSSDEEIVVKPLVLYENKYMDKYNNLLPKVQQLEQLKGCFIIEMTPIGNVIMQYDAEKEAFVYYSDNMIPFRYLETVARKYVCTYNCKELYIERKEIVVQNEQKKPIKTKDLIQSKRNVTKPKVEVEMNRYSNLGRFSNFNMLQKVERHVTDKKRLLTFSDFKRQSVIS
jgi:hypothetical protein